MKTAYIITALLGTATLVLYLTCCKSNTNKTDEQTVQNTDSFQVKKTVVKENNYENLRKMAFEVTPEQLGLTLSVDDTTVYGVIMDWEMGGAIFTLVTFKTGDASMYFSTGGAIIGGGQHANVNSAAKSFITKAKSLLNKATKTDSISLPGIAQVKFFFLTNKGVYVGTEEVKNFENSSSDWLGFFKEGNNVITQIRSATNND